ncbi:miniconductance mechanosensitive channel [Chryseobacterium bernardetii]|jgi:miniconductance mechanosensitive channel|uniref:Miniconductance mechanosensitive channel n=3 Tax=Chryseobacterium TaxID=59732 RepID=A0A543EM19_9FLAO|nr:MULTISPECIES: mechanosensitive ion channel domain-containing protein [Chryseobacterium]MDR6369001.1 miniconductance mechanosensitive channel [Chryseobacterium vietnamense]MDR6440076.1 miniconductance mechanosensitive channel [Chryseobacterium bernardetii]MDR6459672.1 miniconductance mechanosensitive channel [Chryseobacterium vietnamense]MDR6489277.1 miniconductance mechanosensitive channel [Chryseobacterium vietnamense]TQM22612.1 miniconductance mechanosensitive channel [Chryseobacterium aq
MNDQLQETKNFIQELSEQLYLYITRISPTGLDWVFHIIVKLSLLLVLFFITDFVFKFIINSVFRLFHNEEKFPIVKSIYQAKITNSVAHFAALIAVAGIQGSIFPENALPKTTIFIIRCINLGLVLILAGMLYRSLTAFRNYFSIKQDFYKIMALNAISETVKILGLFIFTVVGLCVIFGIKGTTIVGSLGAITAVLVLVFRDTILGFVTGLHVATSKNLKVGDWVSIPKYSIEGNITEINLLTTKITNFDKTVSTIPTYDLMTTEIKNMQVMSESNTRRIKKSIYFNINSFKFLTDEDVERLKEINLISDYLEERTSEIKKEKESLEHKDKIVNGRQLTNIGVFRYYAQKYIENDPDIDKNGTRMVRQLDITPQGLPLEVYCFANDSKWERFEQIQADIFDHLLVASKEFELQVMQVSVKV